MAQMGRLLLRHLPMLQSHSLCACASFHSSPLSPPIRRRFSTAAVRPAQSRSPTQPDLRSDAVGGEREEGSDVESEAGTQKSRNELKREARRAVKWGMDLASFSVPQIKRIIRVASLEREVFEALVTVKKLGPDVREGKRRQFNYIGKLLRVVEPELMDTLIRATKDGDHSTLQSLSALNPPVSEESEEDREGSDTNEEEEGPHIDVATRWLNGLVCKDMEITNEIYSICDVDFDRQELRKLVRRVHSVQEKHKNADEENREEMDKAITKATKPLTRFLRSLAMQLPSDDS